MTIINCVILLRAERWSNLITLEELTPVITFQVLQSFMSFSLIFIQDVGDQDLVFAEPGSVQLKEAEEHKTTDDVKEGIEKNLDEQNERQDTSEQKWTAEFQNSRDESINDSRQEGDDQVELNPNERSSDSKLDPEEDLEQSKTFDGSKHEAEEVEVNGHCEDPDNEHDSEATELNDEPSQSEETADKTPEKHLSK